MFTRPKEPEDFIIKTEGKENITIYIESTCAVDERFRKTGSRQSPVMVLWVTKISSCCSLISWF
jgi:hypothetical protein